MKREALSSPKLLSFCGHLGISKAQAIGHLTLMWDFTAEHAIGGNIGKWDDATIARACDCNTDPASFIAALVASRWVDECDLHRLVVHDWAEHCENWIRSKAARTKVPLLSRGIKSDLSPALKSPLKSTSVADLREAKPEVESRTSCARQNQTKPSLDLDAPSGRRWLDESFDAFWLKYRRGARGEDKAEAKAEWEKIKPDEELFGVIMTALDRQIAFHDAPRGPEDFVPEWPYACRWLKRRRWEDDVPELKSNGTSYRPHTSDPGFQVWKARKQSKT